MRWVLFGVVLYLAIIVQTALVPYVALHSVRPDLVVLLAVHVALAAPPADALLAAWVAGLAVDLCGLGLGERTNLGANALAYGMVALLVVRLRSLVFRDHASTYFIAAFGAAFLIHVLVALHLLYATQQMDRALDATVASLYAAAYTAFVSPYAYWALRRARGVLGIAPVRTLRVR
jgi:rod shape-determining protein MreD